MPDALHAAVEALARRDLTEREVVERLARLGVSEAESRQVVERLRGAGYLDDLKVAAERAARLAARGHGDAAIRHDLEGRGVEADAIEHALAALEAESTRAVRMAERLGDGPKAARALARKGFATDSIEHALAAVAQDPP